MKSGDIPNRFYQLAVWAFFLSLVLFFTGCQSNKSIQLETGKKMEPFAAMDIKGNQVSLQDFAGSAVVLRFFLTDCEFCKIDTPFFVDYYNKNKDRGLKMLYINNSSPTLAKVKSFVHDLNVTFPVIYDKKGELVHKYNIRVQPLTIVLDSNHRLRNVMLGGVSNADLHRIVDPLLQGS